jgi:cytochrome c-type biogenesis protein
MSSFDAVVNSPFFAISVAFVAGLVTSLGPCTFARSITFLGYLGSEELVSKVRGFCLAFILLLGLTVSYSSLGLVGFIANNIIDIGTGLYYLVGIVMVLMGLHFAEIIRLRIPVPSRLYSLKQYYSSHRGPIGSFMLGIIFGLMLCPCCLPGLLAIFAYTFAEGKLLYGITLVFAYTLGHGIPLLLVGLFASTIQMMKALQRWRAHINLATGTLMILAGLLFLWIV